MVPKISIHLLQVRLLAHFRYTSGLDYIKNVDIIAVIKTDHSAIVLHSQGFEETKKGLGFLENEHIDSVRREFYSFNENESGDMERRKERILR